MGRRVALKKDMMLTFDGRNLTVSAGSVGTVNEAHMREVDGQARLSSASGLTNPPESGHPIYLNDRGHEARLLIVESIGE
jgi:hypothetical protein